MERLRSSSTVMAARQMIQTFAGCFGYLSPRRAYAAGAKDETIPALCREREIGALVTHHGGVATTREAPAR